MADPREKQGFEDFAVETREMLESMELNLVRIGRGERDPELLNSLFRSAHTIKGTSGMYDFGAIAEFVHSLENVLDGVRGGRIELTDTLIAAVLRCKDHLLDRMRSYENGRYESDDLLAEGQEAVALLLEAAGEEAPKQQKKQEAVAGERASELWKIHLRCKPNLLANGLDPYPFLRFLTEKGKIEELAVDDSLLPVLTDLDPQSAYLSFDIVYRSTLNHKQIVDAFEFAAHDVELTVEPLIAIGHASGEAVREQKTAKSAPAAKAAAADQKAAKAKTKRSMRVDADKLDLVVDRVGEAVVIASAIHQMALNLKDEYLEELSHRMSRLLTEIRTNSLKLRMVPVETVFARFSRVVYEMGLQLGKPVQLVLHGGETELDKNLIDHLADPLTHMVRNAIDHGIESSPEERERAGKPREATITLSASHRAGEIIIEVSDDGHGINPDAVLRRAVERGLYNEGDPIREDQIYRFIFEPGFSTAKEVTELSGRGVGLDVVRKNVESLRGRIEVESERGKGTMFRIILPLTLANIDGFLLRVGNNQYAIPLDMVNECMEFRAEDFVVGEQNFIRVRGKVIPFINMNELFGEPEEKGSRRNLVIVHAGSLQAGLVVDDLLGRMHSVIKPLGELFEETKGLSGFAVMGDGSVAMILDTGTLLAEVRRLNDRMVEENIERELADVYVD
ncbi:chemotaxis protein CheA [Leptonema illini]|uniref:Chemotaxis protein CheA n=1 Tax=Leptonema illini DSM 21528 TaxID=929563 RepID=H2CLQ5_9LEPT|nr:chemotaxis protein CheA [Leptonema illini]EHQ04666.1 CheA signal transduction histidine kinase [Leptonema illini DSM 21528]